jgi:hypothetical protein
VDDTLTQDERNWLALQAIASHADRPGCLCGPQVPGNPLSARMGDTVTDPPAHGPDTVRTAQRQAKARTLGLTAVLAELVGRHDLAERFRSVARSLTRSTVAHRRKPDYRVWRSPEAA